MNRTQAQAIVRETFTGAFDPARFLNLTRNLVNHLDESKAFARNSPYVKDAFKEHVARFERLGTYTSPNGETLDALIVHLTRDSKLERARTAIRNFVADHLKERDDKDAALVAFVSPSETQWRFSYVKMEYATTETESGKVGVEKKLTPARRFSYIVGAGEACHTAQTRFLDLLQDTESDPTLAQIEEAFSVEAVTKEFFINYVALFDEIKKQLDKLVDKDKTVRDEFKSKNISTVDFAKKLLGQIVFLYFVQKKGWLGVARNQDWGTGPRDFMKRLAHKEFGKYDNFFNDILEPLFYESLAVKRDADDWCKRFQCRIPFLNGGLFEPIGDYDWRKTDIVIPNRLFTNEERVDEMVPGTGVFDVFDRYNFTVNEAEPLEKEVAIDPEMLGKVFENLIEDNRRKGLGAFYTPREIVHYMCQESLINYLETNLTGLQDLSGFAPPTRADLETFIHLGEQISHYEAVSTEYKIKMPKSIEPNARVIDEALANIAVCDPAVGSGAFPVGMMTEIVRARSALTTYLKDLTGFREANLSGLRTPYHFKRHAIQNCLYGVDIDAGAVEIAKLRLWLSLVVDEEDVKEIKPLPNLDYKIVAGNSLLGLPFKSQKMGEVEKLKQKFFDETDHDKKAELKAQVDELLAQVFAASKKSLGYEVNFDFQIYFSEVFRRKNGFDVIIANPPYVDSETMTQNDPEERKLLASLFKTARGNWDLYIVFWELALQKINATGAAALITPNKWLSISYGKTLREYAAPYICQIVDYSKFRAFENVGVFPVVVLMSKIRQSVVQVRTFMENQKLVFEQKLTPEHLKRFDTWGMLLSTNLPLVLKIVSNRAKLSALCDPKEAFTVSEAYELTKLVEEWTPSKIDFFKFVNTGTIDPYVALWGVKLTTYLKSKYSKPVIDKAKIRRLFSRRYDQSASPKIIVSGMRHFECFWDKKGEWVAGKSTVILCNLSDGTSVEFLLGILNSQLVKYFLKECYGSLAMDGGINFTPTNVSEIPIPKGKSKLDSEIAGLVDRILAAKKRNPEADTSALEREIDQLVYRLYGLTEEEIAVVEGK